MDLVSVIVPVYNGETELNRCIDSILNQTYKEIELILIDDGSTDSTDEICRDYAAQDKRVRFFQQCNKGVAAARNRGMDESRGEYIAFIDASDYVEPDYIEKLYLACHHNHCNLSMCNYAEVIGDEIKSANKGGIDKTEIVKNVFDFEYCSSNNN